MKQWIAENKAHIKTTLGIAWPAVMESFFVALVGMVDSLMVSRLGTYAVMQRREAPATQRLPCAPI